MPKVIKIVLQVKKKIVSISILDSEWNEVCIFLVDLNEYSHI